MASRIRIKKNGFGVRIRFGEKLARDEWFHLDLPPEQEAQARDRLARMQAMARRLAEVGEHAEARAYLEEAAKSLHERGFRAIEKMVEGLSPAVEPKRAPVTFRKVVERLGTGELRRLYPEDVKAQATETRDRQRQRLAVFFPVLGSKTFDEITKELLNEAKLLIAEDLSARTRACYLRDLRLVMRLAVDPLGLVEHTPTVKVPTPSTEDLFTFLYPSEEAQVLVALDIPIEMRFLYAFLCRNGTRITETLRLTWDHVNLEAGTIHMAKAWTKTGRARYWDLAPDVLEALKVWREMHPGATHVFVPPAVSLDSKGRRARVPKRLTRFYVWDRFLRDLKVAGLTRREIFSPDDGENQLRIHDTRASFVTLARALGMPDRWIMDRSGHESAKVLEKYDRGARSARERNLGWFAPMTLVLGQSWAKTPKPSTKESNMTDPRHRSHYPPPPINPANLGGQTPSLAPEGPLGPAHLSISGQKLPLTGEHLAELLALAQTARRWHLIAPLGEALEQAEQLRQAAHPKVTDISTARRRKEERGE